MSLWDRMSENSELVGTIGLTVLGIVMYIMLRFSYFVFYNHFGVSPEEVGLGYIEILVRSGPTLIVAVAISVSLTALCLRFALRIEGRELQRYLLLGVVAILLVILVGGPVRANRLARVVQDGTPIHPLTVGELLGIQVDYVSVEPVSSVPTESGQADSVDQRQQPADQEAVADQAVAEEPPADLSQRTSLLYFGQANGIAVLYDHAQQQLIRVPMSEITMVAG
jgi:hypothetical protein